MSGAATRRWRSHPRVRRARRALAIVGDWLPLTRLGALVVAILVAVQWSVAGPRSDIVLRVAVAGALGLAGISILATVSVAVVVALRLRRRSLTPTEAQLETGRVTPTGVSFPSLAWMPLVRVELEVLAPAGVVASLGSLADGTPAWVRASESWRCRDRGVVQELERRWSVGDVFGIARIGVRLRRRVDLRVLPALGKLASIPPLAAFAGGDDRAHPLGRSDGDRVDLRRYERGDPARLIHWKLYARTGKLLVRAHERALSVVPKTVAYLVAGQDDDATAAAARVAIERGAFAADWVFGADASNTEATRREDALDAIVRSIASREDGAAQLGAFVARAERTGPISLVVFAPPTPGIWLDRVLAATRGRVDSQVVIGIDGWVEPRARGMWARWWLLPAPEERVPKRALDEVVGRLRHSGCRVMVVDRASGRVVSGPSPAPTAALRSVA